MLKNVTVVRGTGGCGVSTFSAALAAALAKQGVQTLLVSPDTHTPAFGLWVPDMPANHPAQSLGDVLARPLKLEALADAVYIAPGTGSNLGLFGYLPGEPSDKYVPVDGDKAEVFLSLLSRLSEQVVVDAASSGDAISTVAARRAAWQIRLMDTDSRGVLQFKSRPPEKAEGHTLWLACPRMADDPVSEVADRLHLKFAASLPLLEEAHRKLTEYRLFTPYDNRAYRDTVKMAAETIRREEAAQ